MFLWEWTPASGPVAGYLIWIALPPCEDWMFLQGTPTNSVRMPVDQHTCVKVQAIDHEFNFGPFSEIHVGVPRPAPDPGPIPEPDFLPMILIGLLSLYFLWRKRNGRGKKRHDAP